MFLRCKVRRKDGQATPYGALSRTSGFLEGGRGLAQRKSVLGESTTRRRLAWRRSSAVLEERTGGATPHAVAVSGRTAGRTCLGEPRLSASSCRNDGCAGPRQGRRVLWNVAVAGACSWINSGERGSARAGKGTSWDQVTVLYWSPSPAGEGSEWEAAPRMVSAPRHVRSAGRGCGGSPSPRCIAVMDRR